MKFSTFGFSLATLSLLFLSACADMERMCMTDAGTMAKMNVVSCPALAEKFTDTSTTDTATTERPLVLATAFAGSGIAEVNFNNEKDVPAAIVKQPTTGNLIAVGTSTFTISGVARRLVSAVRIKAADGLPDPTYAVSGNPSPDGKVAILELASDNVTVLGDGDTAGAVAMADGSVWAGYTFTKTGVTNDTDFSITGFSPVGVPRQPIHTCAPDFASYPNLVSPTSPCKNSIDTLKAFMLDVNKLPLLMGQTNVKGGKKIGLLRLKANWQNDTSFAPDSAPGGRQDTLLGYTVIEAEATASEAYPNAMALDASGKILIAGKSLLSGATQTDMFVIRLASNGVLDTTFNPPNLDMNLTKNDEANAIVVQADGKIIVGGYAMGGTYTDFALVRLDPSSGALDTTFGVGGKKRYPLQLPTSTTAAPLYSSGRINSLQMQGTKILAFGQVALASGVNQQIVVRFNSDGSVDTTFGTNGEMRFGNTVTGVAQEAVGRASLWDGSAFYFVGEAIRGLSGYDFMVGKLN